MTLKKPAKVKVTSSYLQSATEIHQNLAQILYEITQLIVHSSYSIALF